ncbi:putative nucleic-acid-binding protein, contains PIN domain [Geoglobus ahangari]|uniref:Putative nucleic-acid-binding protein, contains PIN domain n=1 Tax=Geoglobus ahangari TaxID=113653 RepID=A0A0F7IFH0_9EURY|nr:PIN domain-containing protein [Geoglobus ahangari]AKG91592.1 putative nucleic-acid-binding protein, contains PIN domain [Geoglobus ahangari]
MYLDTDVILSQIKEKDWLKDIVKRKLESINEEFVTSAITIVECQIVLIREFGRDEAVKVPERIEELGVKILPLSKEVLEISSNLLKRYSKLNIFDSIHLAHVIHEKERILSTDRLFDEVEGIVRIDPLK